MKVILICFSLENTLLLSPKILEVPAIGLNHKHKIKCNFFRPFAVVTNTTGVSPLHPESLQPVFATCAICGSLPGTQGLFLAQFQSVDVFADGLS